MIEHKPITADQLANVEGLKELIEARLADEFRHELDRQFKVNGPGPDPGLMERLRLKGVFA